MRKTIPDLRIDHNEFTLEHCSVLLARLTVLIKKLEGEDMADIADQVNTEVMREHLLNLMSAQQLSLVFDSELGKGFITGMFFTKYILPESLED